MGSAITIRLLGELAVELDDDAVTLPPSKKTRALLGYLALTGREHRRARLCSLLWDGASDPRGSLRWSLSRIRAVVDADGKNRLHTTREAVSFEPHDTTVDVVAVREGLQAGVETLPTEQLVELARWHRGELLEGLELSDQHEFAAWLVAQREAARTRQVQLLTAISDRLNGDPEAALPHARTLAQIDPLDESAHARLVRLLVSAGKWREAQQEVESTRQMFRSLQHGAPRQVEEVWRKAQAVRANVPPEPHPIARPSSQAAVTTTFVGELPFVGRSRECADLSTVFGKVRDQGRLRTVLITGDPGVGKSRVLREFRANAGAEGASILRGRSYEAEETRAYGPWIDAMRRLPTEQIPDSDRAALGLLLPELEAPQEQQRSRDRLFAAVAGLLRRQTETSTPLVLTFDDVQWLDPASAMLIHYVARTLADAPVVMLMAARPGEVPDNDALSKLLRGLRKDTGLDEVELGPLSRGDVVALARAVDPEVDGDKVAEQADGNPLFALELVRAFEEESTAIPQGLAGIVRDRLERLSSAARDTVRWCSALGSRIELGLLEALIDIDAGEFVDAIEEIERHGLLEPLSDAPGTTPVYRFAHDLVRRAIYDELSAPRRRLMHGRAAELLSRREDADGSIATEVARQATLAGDAALAVRACLGAARRSLRMFANDEALAFSRQGLHLVEELGDPVRTRLRIELHETQFGARRPTEPGPIIEDLQALGRRALDLDLREHARLAFHLMSYLQWEEGEWDSAAESMLHAARVARGANDQERAEAMAEAARCLVRVERDLGQAEAMATEANEVLRRLNLETWTGCDVEGMLALHHGRLDDARNALRRARSIAQLERDHYREYQSLELLVIIALDRGELDRAEPLVDELRVLAGRMRPGSEAAFAEAARALVSHARVDDPETLDEVLGRLRDVDAKQRLCLLLVRAARVELARGNLERARAMAEESRDLATALELPSDVARAHAVLLRTAMRSEDPDAVRTHREALEDLSDRPIARHVATRIRELLETPGE